MSEIIMVENFDYSIIDDIEVLPLPSGNRGTRDKTKFLNAVCAFDIETTRIREIEQSVMYIWQFQLDLRYTVFGRSWDSFLTFLQEIKKRMPAGTKLMIYVHNLSYEFTFLKGVYQFEPEEVFAVDSRKVLKCTMYGVFEFRCSYIQTNMSLAEFTKKMNVTHKKLDDFVYTEVRYPWTQITDRELEYCQNDVLGLVEAIKEEMIRDEDTLYTIPFTSTGYVRRDVKKAMRKISHYYLHQIQPDFDTYSCLRRAFRGGNAHANRYYATGDGTQHILKNVHSADRSSSYPDVICNRMFPVKQFYRCNKRDCTEEYLRGTLIGRYKKPVVFDCIIMNLKLRDEFFGCPYLSKSKCRNIYNDPARSDPADKSVFDNGRVLSSPYLETTLTDIDLEIMDSEYSFEIVPTEIYYSSYGKLPQPLIDVVISYYKAKTELKGVAGQENFYMKSKNKLNSIYGMMATNPVRVPIIYDYDPPEDKEEFYTDDSADLIALLEKYSRSAFITYAWGVWVTAWARYELELGIRAAGDGFVYCDTDSVKYLGEADFSAINAEKIRNSTNSGAYATDPKGTTHYMGVFEQEEDYTEFVTMGAKKYAGKHSDGKLEITIAGVQKKAGAAELEERGGLAAMNEGFIFKKAGGLEAVYNDKPAITEYQIDGHTLKITSNVVLRESTYTLSLIQEYRDLLRMSAVKLDNLISEVL